MHFGPTAPAEALSAVASAARAADSAAQAASVVTPAPPPSASTAPAAPVVTITVSHGAILSCKSEEGESFKGKDCGWLTGLDPLVQARLKHLAQAPVAADNPGKLSVILGLDFKNNRISLEGGKSSTVKDVDSLKAFIAGDVKSMSLKPVDHTKERYSVAYTVNISTGAPADAASAAASATSPTQAASASSSASHEVLPDGMAAVDLGGRPRARRRPPHGSRRRPPPPRHEAVQVGTVDSGYYKIKYGPSYASEGYVYRGAIGK